MFRNDALTLCGSCGELVRSNPVGMCDVIPCGGKVVKSKLVEKYHLALCDQCGELIRINILKKISNTLR